MDPNTLVVASTAFTPPRYYFHFGSGPRLWSLDAADRFDEPKALEAALDAARKHWPTTPFEAREVEVDPERPGKWRLR